jgi:rRNA maturation protein Nop10
MSGLPPHVGRSGLGEQEVPRCPKTGEVISIPYPYGPGITLKNNTFKPCPSCGGQHRVDSPPLRVT